MDLKGYSWFNLLQNQLKINIIFGQKVNISQSTPNSKAVSANSYDKRYNALYSHRLPSVDSVRLLTF